MKPLTAAIQLLNQLVENGTLPSYAIGGAVGAAFYVQAVHTEDLEIFASLIPAISSTNPSILLVQNPAHYQSASRALVEEAIEKANSVTYHGIPTRVLTAEYLCAIAIELGRHKDVARVIQFVDEGKVDLNELKRLVQAFHLESKAAKIPGWPDFPATAGLSGPKADFIRRVKATYRTDATAKSWEEKVDGLF